MVDVTLCLLEACKAELTELKECLSLGEQRRASAFRREEDRNVYIMTHALLRQRLASICKCLPQELEFMNSAYGKPFLADYPALHFSLSHTDGAGVVAKADRVVGVDIERIRNFAGLDELAAEVFEPAEANRLQVLTGERLTASFFEQWTKKEAILKAAGTGFAVESRCLLPVADGIARLEQLGRESYWEVKCQRVGEFVWSVALQI